MKKAILYSLTLFFFSSSLFCGTYNVPKQKNIPHYLITTTEENALNNLKNYSKTALKNGRIHVIELSIDFKNLPTDLQKVIRPINLNEINIYQFDKKNFQTKTDSNIENIFSNISETRIMDNLVEFTNIDSRKYNSDGNAAARNLIAEKFKSIGLETTIENFFSSWGKEGANVIGIKRSNSIDAKQIVFIAHFDSVGKYRAGADDNASGTVGLIEIASVLMNENINNYDLVFIAADGEESGLIGSTKYVNARKSTGELKKIRYVVDMDMIGFNKSNRMHIETDEKYLKDAEILAAMIKTYTPYTPIISTPAWGSDHVPFIENAVPASITVEDWDNHNPCYHKECDKIDRMDLNFMINIIKANIAFSLAL